MTAPPILELTSEALAEAAQASLPVAAAKYAALGLYVFPLKPGDKEPLHKGAFKTATRDAAQVAAWWHTHPNANIGCWPGPAGLLVVDVDGPEGEATAERLGLTRLPTLQVRTGRANGGRHLYFLKPSGAEIGNADLGPGLDVRADKGYVLLPPSRHPSGAVYRWEAP